MENKSLKTVAIIGRPNVGKSTLFNRLVGKRIAIETPIPGTTRDRLFGEVTWRNEIFNLIDVAGVEKGSKNDLVQSMQEGIELAISSADLILFVTDWNEKDNHADRAIARSLIKSGKPVVLAVNKADNITRIEQTDEFCRLGFQNPVPVSAISGKSSGDLLDVITAGLDQIATKTESARDVADIDLAIIGRPNVGKSTLLNTIVGEKRAIVSEVAGTTRDVISVNFYHKGKNIFINDTAGLRRPGKIGHDTIESFSAIRTERALRGCDVAIIIIDAVEGLVALDANILGKAKEWGKGVVLAINKIDLIPGNREDYLAKMLWQLQNKLNFAPWLPVVFISARDDENVKALLSQVVKADESRHTLISEQDLTEILIACQKLNPQLADIKTFRQKSTNPPVFEISYPKKKIPHYTQVRYLENKLRDIYPMSGTPIFIDSLPGGSAGNRPV